MHSESEFCHNCGIRLNGRFCSACGQKALPLDIKLHHFVDDLAHEMLHVDGRIFQSIRHLIWSPGFLTREYVQGRRARWISAIRLYLIFSFAFFAMSALSPEGRVRVSATGETAAEQIAAVQKLGYKDIAELREAVAHAVFTWTPRAMFVLMPVFAWFVALAYRRVDRNYLHHLYFALHVHAAWFALGAISIASAFVSPLFSDVVGTFTMLYGLLYTVLALQCSYGGRLRDTLVRATAVLIAYVLTVSIALAAIVAPVVFGRIWWKS